MSHLHFRPVGSQMDVGELEDDLESRASEVPFQVDLSYAKGALWLRPHPLLLRDKSAGFRLVKDPINVPPVLILLIRLDMSIVGLVIDFALKLGSVRISVVIKINLCQLKFELIRDVVVAHASV